MRKQTILILGLIGLSMTCRRADAIMVFEQLEPGEVSLGVPEKIAQPLFELLSSQKTVGGHTESGTWWDGYFRGEYFYRGDNEKLQAFIDQLEELDHPHCRVVFTDQEGVWEGNSLLPREEALLFDWSVAVTHVRVADLKKHRQRGGKGIVNDAVIVLTVHLGHGLDRSKLDVSHRLLNNADIPDSSEAPVDQPADAMHAILRARLD